jgi:hypothetical protein
MRLDAEKCRPSGRARAGHWNWCALSDTDHEGGCEAVAENTVLHTEPRPTPQPPRPLSAEEEARIREFWGETPAESPIRRVLATLDATPAAPAGGLDRDQDCGNCQHSKDDHSALGAERCGVPWCECPGFLTLTASVPCLAAYVHGSSCRCAAPQPTAQALDAERLARALRSVAGRHPAAAIDTEDARWFDERAAAIAAAYAADGEASR